MPLLIPSNRILSIFWHSYLQYVILGAGNLKEKKALLVQRGLQCDDFVWKTESSDFLMMM
jgi:hypothetical protein